MTLNYRTRDPGLQPERTALSWHRTTFSVVILTLATARIGFSRGNLASAWLAGVAVGLTLALLVLSRSRQQQLAPGTELTTPVPVAFKRLLSLIIGLEAMSLALPAALSLLTEGVF